MTGTTKSAWAITETLTPMFRIRLEAERGAEGPDEEELASWLQMVLAHQHTSEDVGMFAHWLATAYEAGYTGDYDCAVTYRVAYTTPQTKGVRIVRRV